MFRKALALRMTTLASLAARFWASTDRDAVAASRASVIFRRKYRTMSLDWWCGICTCRPDSLIQLGLVLLEPLLALLHGASIFAVLY